MGERRNIQGLDYRHRQPSNGGLCPGEAAYETHHRCCLDGRDGRGGPWTRRVQLQRNGRAIPSDAELKAVYCMAVLDQQRQELARAAEQLKGMRDDPAAPSIIARRSPTRHRPITAMRSNVRSAIGGHGRPLRSANGVATTCSSTTSARRKKNSRDDASGSASKIPGRADNWPYG